MTGGFSRTEVRRRCFNINTPNISQKLWFHYSPERERCPPVGKISRQTRRFPSAAPTSIAAQGCSCNLNYSWRPSSPASWKGWMDLYLTLESENPKNSTRRTVNCGDTSPVSGSSGRLLCWWYRTWNWHLTMNHPHPLVSRMKEGPWSRPSLVWKCICGRINFTLSMMPRIMIRPIFFGPTEWPSINAQKNSAPNFRPKIDMKITLHLDMSLNSLK